MPAGFERCRAAEPIVGVFYFSWVHRRALRVLFGYTVIEARHLRDGEATRSGFRVAERLGGLGQFLGQFSGEGRSYTGILWDSALDFKGRSPA
ncbi:hypothetical protein D3C86_2034350 [compost metagenome]